MTNTAPTASASGFVAAESPTPDRVPQQVTSAYAQLKERQRAQKEAIAAEHMRVVLATHAEYRADCQEANERLQNEDSETKAQRAAMNTRTAPVSSTDIGGATNKRNQRLRFCKLYSEAVAAFRERRPSEAAPPSSPSAAGSSQGELATRVLVRARPLFEDEASRGEWEAVSALPRGVVVHEGTDKLKGAALVQILRHHTFGGNMHAVSTDDEVFGAMRYLLERAVAGGIATLFCYGMTGSGKTYSMAGIHSRVPAELFSQLSAASAATGTEGALTVRFSAFDFLGKRCFELLPANCAAADDGPDDASMLQESQQKREVFLRVDSEGATHVCGVAEHIASDAVALKQLLHAAVSRRETSATTANAASSRSHAVYLMQVPGGGRLVLIDLAGSEASEESLFHNKQQIAESKEIMNSLATLRQCLRARSMQDARQVPPFRESVLTRVLKDALTDPSSATTLLACVSPSCSHTEHSIRTLRTAAYLTGDDERETREEEEVKTPAVRDTREPKHWDHETLQKWVEEQPFAEQVQLKAAMDGKEIMKLAQNRLAACCSGDKAVAAELFAALRKAAKEAAALALEERRTQTAWAQRKEALELQAR